MRRVRRRPRCADARACAQGRGQQLATETAVMLREREQLAAVAAERRDALRTLEGRMARERAVLEAQSKAERLRQVSLLEDQYSCVRSSPLPRHPSSHYNPAPLSSRPMPQKQTAWAFAPRQS